MNKAGNVFWRRLHGLPKQLFIGVCSASGPNDDNRIRMGNRSIQGRFADQAKILCATLELRILLPGIEIDRGAVETWPVKCAVPRVADKKTVEELLRRRAKRELLNDERDLAEFPRHQALQKVDCSSGA